LSSVSKAMLNSSTNLVGENHHNINIYGHIFGKKITAKSYLPSEILLATTTDSLNIKGRLVWILNSKHQALQVITGHYRSQRINVPELYLPNHARARTYVSRRDVVLLMSFRVTSSLL